MSGEPQGTTMLTIHESIITNGVASIVRRGRLITSDQLSFWGQLVSSLLHLPPQRPPAGQCRE
jgi:hypothetical protein